MGQALMLRPPETEVNRYSGQHDHPDVGCQKKEHVPAINSRMENEVLHSNISRRVAGRFLPPAPLATPSGTPLHILQSDGYASTFPVDLSPQAVETTRDRTACAVG